QMERAKECSRRHPRHRSAGGQAFRKEDGRELRRKTGSALPTRESFPRSPRKDNFASTNARARKTPCHLPIREAAPTRRYTEFSFHARGLEPPRGLRRPRARGIAPVVYSQALVGSSMTPRQPHLSMYLRNGSVETPS